MEEHGEEYEEDEDLAASIKRKQTTESNN